jgi:hypothetical protein
VKVEGSEHRGLPEMNIFRADDFEIMVLVSVYPYRRDSILDTPDAPGSWVAKTVDMSFGWKHKPSSYALPLEYSSVQSG